MAWLEKKTKVSPYRVVFRVGKRRVARSLKTKNPRLTRARLARIEETLLLIDSGRLPVPSAVEFAAFVISDGKLVANAPGRAVWGVGIDSPKKDVKRENEAPWAQCPGASEATFLTHPRSGYPSDGCVPAEPSSVSPDKSTKAPKQSFNTRGMREKIPGVGGVAPEYADPNH